MEFTGQFFVGKALADCSGHDYLKAVTVMHWQLAGSPIVETEFHFIKVPKQMKRLNRNIRSVNHALGEAPEILVSVGMHFPAHVLYSVIYHLMGIIRFQTFIGQQRIGIERRASGNVFPYLCLKRFLFAILDNHTLNSAVRSLAFVATLKHSKDSRF